MPASKVVLAVGHSSRAMYRTLAARDVALSPKPFALGLRVEHPQALIDTIQYGREYAAGQLLSQNSNSETCLSLLRLASHMLVMCCTYKRNSLRRLWQGAGHSICFGLLGGMLYSHDSLICKHFLLI